MGSALGYLVVIVAAILLSAVFSGAETGLYQMSRLQLRLALERKQHRARLLVRILKDRPAALAALLLGNNLAIQVASSTITLWVVAVAGPTHTAEWIATAIATPLLFVFAELLPKNLFLLRAHALMLGAAPLLYGWVRTARCSGAVALLRGLSAATLRLLGVAPAPAQTLGRHEIRALLRDTHEEGLFSGLQTGILNRTVTAATTPVKEAMTPWALVQTVPVTADRDRLLAQLRRGPYTRIPVVTGGRDMLPLGWIDLYRVLGAASPAVDLRDSLTPFDTIDERTAVMDALETLQRGSSKLLLVTRQLRSGRPRPVGIVTMKDLAEEVLGELASW